MPDSTTTSREEPRPRTRFVRQILRLAGPYWSSGRKWRARGTTALLFALTVAQVGLTVWGNYWNRDLFDALGDRSVHGVLVQVGVFALIFATSIAVTASHLWVKRRLQLDWRAWLSERLIGRWLEGGRHYRLQLVPGEHDNPDQRIAEDVRIATEGAVALAHTLAYSLMTLGLFIPILWSVSGPMTVAGTGIRVPGYMVPLAFLYAGIGAALGWMLGRPLVRTTNRMQSAEANFRFGLSRAREHSEAIALAHGEPLERRGAAARFAEIVRSWDRQSLAYMGLASFSTGYGGLLPVFPILVAAPQYIAGAMSLGVLMQAANAFQQLTGALSWPVDNVGGMASCRASAERVLSLYRDVERLDAGSSAATGGRIVLAQSASRHLLIENLCISEPSGDLLLDHFSTEVQRGEHVLVTGDSEVTTALFRVIGGLWPWGSGRVLLPRDRDRGILLLPQRPFLPEGRLREALSYPRPPDAFSNEAIHYALECAGVVLLVRRLDEKSNWEQELPLRTQQQLAFARALLLRPVWVISEDATNGFDLKGELLTFETLLREIPDATLLTIRSSPGLERLHPRKIVLKRAARE